MTATKKARDAPKLTPGTSLEAFQAAFCEYLSARTDLIDSLHVPGLGTARAGSKVLRVTAITSSIDALMGNYPTVATLVGEEWFRAAAFAYVQQFPPTDPRLVLYGAAFPDFLSNFEPAQDLFYLPAVAALDRCWLESQESPDCPALDMEMLRVHSPEGLQTLHLRTHPSLRMTWSDDAPAYSIWRANRFRSDKGWLQPGTWNAEGALLVRHGSSIVHCQVERPSIDLLTTFERGELLGVAFDHFATLHPSVNAPALFAELLKLGAFCANDPETPSTLHIGTT